MKMKIYVIYDAAAKIYNKPFFQINDEVCLRAVRQMRNGDNDLALNPQDFSVWYLGTYEDDTAQIDLCGVPKVIAKCHELFAETKNDE